MNMITNTSFQKKKPLKSEKMTSPLVLIVLFVCYSDFIYNVIIKMSGDKRVKSKESYRRFKCFILVQLSLYVMPKFNRFLSF